MGSKRPFSSAVCFGSLAEIMTNHVIDSKLPATNWMQDIMEWCGKFDKYLSKNTPWLKEDAVYVTFDELVVNKADRARLIEVHQAMMKVEKWLHMHPIHLKVHCLQTHLRSLLYISTSMNKEVEKLPNNGSYSDREVVDGLLMKLYFEQSLPNFLAWAAESTYGVQEQVCKELWITMVFRAMCWYNLHGVDNTDKPVDPKRLNSQHPIYIG